MKTQLQSLLEILRNPPPLFASGGEIRDVQILKRRVHADIFDGRLRFQTDGATAIVEETGEFRIDPIRLSEIDFDSNLALQEAIARPLFYFIADSGQRGSCIFCPKPLTKRSYREVGYGPRCAQARGLYYFTSDDVVRERPDDSGIMDCFGDDW